MKRLLKTVLENLGYKVQGIRYTPRHLLEPSMVRVLEFDDIICRYMVEHRQNLTFIQVGAFDGVTKDPLRPYIERYGWRGVLVEPQPKAAEKLRKLYHDNDFVHVVEAALGEQVGKQKIYTIEGENIPTWVEGMASFKASNILKHENIVPGIRNMVKAISVSSTTFDHIMSELSINEIDLLQIDTEGADYFILSLFPFDKVRPAIVHWEVKHFSKLEREKCFDFLANFGYVFAPSGSEDMMALKI